jgi:hypothetical protein
MFCNSTFCNSTFCFLTFCNSTFCFMTICNLTFCNMKYCSTIVLQYPSSGTSPNKMPGYINLVWYWTGSCITGNWSSAFIRFPQSHNNMLIIIFFKKYVVKPVRCMNVWLGSVKPSWDWLCVLSWNSWMFFCSLESAIKSVVDYRVDSSRGSTLMEFMNSLYITTRPPPTTIKIENKQLIFLKKKKYIF